MVHLAAFAVIVAVALPAGACAQGDASMSGEAAEARARRQADSIRQAILGHASFAGFAEARCAPGDVRTFERDSSGTVGRLLKRIELLIASHAAFDSLDSETGRALLRAVARLETGGPGPQWDVLSGPSPRAFNPVLPTTLLNPVSGACEDTPGTTPFGLVLPEVTGFVAPKDSGAASYLVEYGSGGVKRVRDAFVALHRDSAVVLRHTRVNAHAMWGDYAIISVVRAAEDRGVVPLPNLTGGAVYLFHRAEGEWRLLAVVRNW